MLQIGDKTTSQTLFCRRVLMVPLNLNAIWKSQFMNQIERIFNGLYTFNFNCWTECKQHACRSSINALYSGEMFDQARFQMNWSFAIHNNFFNTFNLAKLRSCPDFNCLRKCFYNWPLLNFHKQPWAYSLLTLICDFVLGENVWMASRSWNKG